MPILPTGKEVPMISVVKIIKMVYFSGFMVRASVIKATLFFQYVMLNTPYHYPVRGLGWGLPEL